MALPAPSRPTPREPDRRRCPRPPTTPQSQVAHPPGEPPDPVVSVPIPLVSADSAPSRNHPTAGFRLIDAIEPVRITEEPLTSSGSAFWTANSRPRTLVLNVLSKCSSVISPNVPNS